MRRFIFVTLVLLFVAVAGYGCSRPTEAGQTDEQIAAATAAAQAFVEAVPTDVPIHPDAEKLKFAAENTYITYEVAGGVDAIVEYYRTELEALGWEKRNNSPESPLGGALTLLRSKPDKNISVTIQSIPNSDSVRVLMTIISK